MSDQGTTKIAPGRRVTVSQMSVRSFGFHSVGHLVPNRFDIAAQERVEFPQYLFAKITRSLCQRLLRGYEVYRTWLGSRLFSRMCQQAVIAAQIQTDFVQALKEPIGCVFLFHEKSLICSKQQLEFLKEV